MIDGKLDRSLEYIEAPAQTILASMESRGIGFFSDKLKRIEKEVKGRIEELECESRSITKDASFLLSSPQQVSQYLYDVLKLAIPSGFGEKQIRQNKIV